MICYLSDFVCFLPSYLILIFARELGKCCGHYVYVFKYHKICSFYLNGMAHKNTSNASGRRARRALLHNKILGTSQVALLTRTAPPNLHFSSTWNDFNFDVRNSRGTHYIFSLLPLPLPLAKFLMRPTPMNLFNFSAPQNVIKFNATLARLILSPLALATQDLKASLNLTVRSFVPALPSPALPQVEEILVSSRVAC